MPVVEGRQHLSDRPIDKTDGISKPRTWCASAVEVAITSQLLSDADRLEIHAENRRRAHSLSTCVIEASDLVQNGAYLDPVVPFDRRNSACKIAPAIGTGAIRVGRRLRCGRKVRPEFAVDQAQINGT